MVNDWEKDEGGEEEFLRGRKKGAKAFADEEPDLTAEDEESDEEEEDLYGDDLDMGDGDE